MVIHLGHASPRASCGLPGSTRGPRVAALRRLPPYLALLRVGFTLPLPVASSAVRSYRTISPLPVRRGLRRYIFCGTFRGLAPPRRYLAPCPAEPGLSSLPAAREERPSGRLPRDNIRWGRSRTLMGSESTQKSFRPNQLCRASLRPIAQRQRPLIEGVFLRPRDPRRSRRGLFHRQKVQQYSERIVQLQLVAGRSRRPALPATRRTISPSLCSGSSVTRRHSSPSGARITVSCTLVSSRASTTSRSAPEHLHQVDQGLAHAVGRLVEDRESPAGRAMPQSARRRAWTCAAETPRNKNGPWQTRNRKRRDGGTGTRDGHDANAGLLAGTHQRETRIADQRRARVGDEGYARATFRAPQEPAITSALVVLVEGPHGR